MKYLCRFILKLIGWKIIGKGMMHPHSVAAVFPHTSYWDGIIGYIAMKALGVKFSVVSAKWLFFFPLGIVMKYILHSFPVEGNTVRTAVKILKENPDTHLVICPEGQLKPTEEWHKGFYVIAREAEVSINFVIFNYHDKTINLAHSLPYGTLKEMDFEGVKYYIRNFCGSGVGKYPEKFRFPR